MAPMLLLLATSNQNLDLDQQMMDIRSLQFPLVDIPESAVQNKHSLMQFAAQAS